MKKFEFKNVFNAVAYIVNEKKTVFFLQFSETFQRLSDVLKILKNKSYL